MTKKIVAIRECLTGNEHAATSWAETAVFNADQPLDDVLQWASTLTHWGDGRLILTVPTYTAPDKLEPKS